MSDAPFGLYRTRTLGAGQRVGAGQAVALDLPVVDAGVTLFRASFWLRVPALAAGVQALRLAPASQLQVRFAPRRFDAGLDDRAWFPSVVRPDPDTVRIELAWPAQVVAVASPRRGLAREIELFRADGDAVAAKATTTGRTGSDFAEPWVGSPLVVKLGDTAEPLRERARAGGGVVARAAAVGGAAAIGIDASAVSASARAAFADVPALTIAGVPTSPRLKLVAEQPGAASTLLWQGMVAGEQGTVVLPAHGVVDEWAPAFEQVLKLAADPGTVPALLRLDVESDAPCSVTFVQLALVAETETELLAEPWRASFGGGQPERQALAIVVPAGTAPESVVLAGRVVADGAGTAGAAADGRVGALLGPDAAGFQPIDVAAPASIAGFALPWQPLSPSVELRLRVLADGGVAGPGNRVLAQAAATFDTPRATSLALRWPAVDVQAQRLWLEATMVEGQGLWPFAAGGGGAAGWIEQRGPAPVRTPLPHALAATPIAAGDADAPTRPISALIGAATVAAALPAGSLRLEVAKALVPRLATEPLVFAGAVRGTVTIESARMVVRTAG